MQSSAWKCPEGAVRASAWPFVPSAYSPSSSFSGSRTVCLTGAACIISHAPDVGETAQNPQAAGESPVRNRGHEPNSQVPQ